MLPEKVGTNALYSLRPRCGQVERIKCGGKWGEKKGGMGNKNLIVMYLVSSECL